MDKISNIVGKVYNKIAKAYYTHRDLNKFNTELEKLVSLLPKDAYVLDVGCGAGIPTAKFLIKRGIKVTSPMRTLMLKKFLIKMIFLMQLSPEWLFII